jgi:hypothetical protein
MLGRDGEGLTGTSLSFPAMRATWRASLNDARVERQRFCVLTPANVLDGEFRARTRGGALAPALCGFPKHGPPVSWQNRIASAPPPAMWKKVIKGSIRHSGGASIWLFRRDNPVRAIASVMPTAIPRMMSSIATVRSASSCSVDSAGASLYNLRVWNRIRCIEDALMPKRRDLLPGNLHRPHC